MTPFVCRWKRGEDGKLYIQMVGGERRHRAVDFLRRKKELVKDPRTASLNDRMDYEYQYRPADEVYHQVLCQIYAVSDDIEALAFAYTENDCRINQGPGHDVAVVMELRQAGASDERIMEVMSKDEKWLRDTDSLVEQLGEATLKELIEDRIDREAALELLHVKEKHGEDVATKRWPWHTRLLRRTTGRSSTS
jgi:SOS response regulatory protein OraA/RecX